MLRIKKATYFGDYKLKILFSNGKTKIVDFEEWIFENDGNFYLKPLKNIEFFKKFDLDESKYTVCWPNGADFCPDVLYEIGQEARKPRKIARSRKVKTRKTLSRRRTISLKSR